jgi:rhamnulose-1-phosphate aldolase/alcohol dehydrogenase
MPAVRTDPAAPTRPAAQTWDAAVAPHDEVGLLLYRSNLLGADLRVTNFAGGNTSCKLDGVDAVTGAATNQLWIKGSGGDLGTLRREGLAVLDTGRVRGLERGYRGVDHEDDQVALLGQCLCEPRGAAPSIDTPLHALLPAAHVDHVHPDAVIAVATADGGRGIVEELYGDQVGWLDWQRPGFDLALRLRDLVAARPGLRGVVLGGHGLICWGETSRSCYHTTIELIERAQAHIEKLQAGRGSPPFGARRVADLDAAARAAQATRMLPLLRGLCSAARRPVAHFRDDPPVLEFIGAESAPALAAQGTSCPDHFLRTKRTPLLLDLPPDADPVASRPHVEAALDGYREQYASYYRRFAGAASPPMRSADPVVVLWPGVGMFTLAASKSDARIAAEFYVNAIAVMRGATILSGYRGLDEAEAFRIEYWALEEAKLRRMAPPKPLSGRVAMVTGGTGGIGRAVARRLAADGACVVLADLDLDGSEQVVAELGEQGMAVACDVADEAQVESAFAAAALRFGGVDVLVNNAGISVSRSLLDHSVEDYERLHRVIDRGSFLMSRAFARQAVVQGAGGDIVYVVSKNAVAAQPDNVGYASAKAAQLHQVRVLAAELGVHGIRVNAVNPDAVVRGSKIFAGDWGTDRAATYGVPVERLGEFYAQRTLLGREVLPEDIADAVAVLAGPALGKTTGAVIPVDGGVAAAFLR